MYLKGKKILIGVTASIAAYKSILLVRLLIKDGAEVKVIMTPDAKNFVSPLVLSVLSKNKVSIEWEENYEWNNHVTLGRWADFFILAPLSCNTLAKMAVGQCDNLLMAVYLSAICPVAVAPAMDEDMWHHPTVIKNISIIKQSGVKIIDVTKGELASGLYGDGRMAEPEEIYYFIIEQYCRGTELTGHQVLITAGPMNPLILFVLLAIVLQEKWGLP
jgi:phosphopantothenoylcysteine decarboxylase / phosphopantothenate---cysteine ligase